MSTRRHRLLPSTAVLAAALTSVAGPAGPASAADRPVNDDRAAATAVEAHPFTDVADLSTATVEDGEPLDACVGMSHTVWYALTVPRDMAVQVDTGGSTTDTAFVVWDEDLRDPHLCAGDDGASAQARASFLATAGTTYWLQVGADLDHGGEPGSLRLTVDQAPKPTGKPATDGQHTSILGAGAVFSQPSVGDGGFHLTQLTLNDIRDRERGSTPGRRVRLELLSQRLTVHADGSRTAEEWFGIATLDPSQVQLAESLRSAGVEVGVRLEHSQCISRHVDDEDSTCETLAPQAVRVRAAWTGTGSVERNLLRLDERGFAVRAHGTAHLAWRDATVVATATGTAPIDLSEPVAAALTRDAVMTTSWDRR